MYVHPVSAAFFVLSALYLMYPMACWIRYIVNRQDAIIRVLCDECPEFEDDLNNPYYWVEGKAANPDEYVPSDKHDPEDPSIK